MEKDLRHNKRVKTSFYIKIRGTDAKGEEFEGVVKATDFSKSGAAFFLERDVTIGSKLYVSIPLPSVVVRIENFENSDEKKYGVVFRPYEPDDPEKE